ncbi:MAG: hypothetical protein JRJ48_01000 [Deltaproteobacteria bacterium]|nr:hypothetical protein [Deltaproteobacteria bacterium]
MKKRFPFFLSLLFIFTVCPAGATTFYLIKTTSRVQNGFVAGQSALLFVLEDPPLPSLSFKSTYLHGTAFLTLPSEKESTTHRAMLNAMAARARQDTSVRVAAAALKEKDRIKSAINITTLTLFKLSGSPENITISNYTLHVAFTAQVASASSCTLEDFFTQPGGTYLSALFQDIKDEINGWMTGNVYECPAP